MSEPFYSVSLKDLYSILGAGPVGLTKAESQARLKKYGQNILPKAKVTALFFVFLSQFTNPLIYILSVAALVSFAVSNTADGFIIIAVIVVSGFVGFVQEFKAGQALKKLKEMVTYKARVLYDGVESIIMSANVVKGDIINLAPGDKIPADARIISCENFQVIEAALTGESVPSDKKPGVVKKDSSLADRENMVFMGTAVARGHARAIVVATGKDTEVGNIATLVEETETDASPLKNKLKKFGRTISFWLVGINLAIFILGVATGRPIFEMFLTAISVAVAAIPEGLLPAATIILAVGMFKIAKKNGLVRKMIAAETLGSVSVICTDKTGTLTKGEMAVAHIILPGGVKEVSNAENILILKAVALCNNAIIENPEDALTDWRIIGDPTEKALILATQEAGVEKKKEESFARRVGEIPFDSEYKYMATLHSVETAWVKTLGIEKEKDCDYLAFIKGAPEKVIVFADYLFDGKKQTKLTKEKKEELMREVEKYTSKGLRIIAVAHKFFKDKDFDSTKLDGCVFVGFVALKDPLRPEAKETLELALKAGIRSVVVTGDHSLTAKAIVEELGIKIGPKNLVTGVELDKMDDNELHSIIEEVKIFSRVEPRHKVRIVAAWQFRGAVVAMTGDGVNDAPALKRANIGVALGSGTDVAKEVSDLVLLDNNFKTIIEAIKNGRVIYNNLRKVLLLTITKMFTEVIMIGSSVVFGFPLPLVPVQILWVNLIGDITPEVSLAFEDDLEDVMNDKPKSLEEPLFTHGMQKLIIFFALVMDFALVTIYLIFLKVTGDLAAARTIAFLGIGITTLFYIFSARGYNKSIFKMPLFGNLYIVASVLFGATMYVISIYVPFFSKILGTVKLSLTSWVMMIIFGLSSIIVYEIGKWLFLSKEVIEPRAKKLAKKI